MELPLPSTSTAPAPTSGEPVLVACHLCNKQFKNVILRNRHVTRVHKAPVLHTKASNIKCPLCKEEADLQKHEALRKHLEKHHQINIEFLSLQFSNQREFNMWKDSHEIERNYAMHRSINKAQYKMLYFDCNRSDHKGYKPKYFKRTEKSGGTIKMKGVCPSRLICKLNIDGQVLVSYWKTHAGHDEELRSKHLSKSERPNANNYQDRIIIKAHKKAESVKSNMEVTKDSQVYGQFKVTSFRDPSKQYIVSVNQVCQNECRTLYCRVCKICIHRYQCECPEYVVRNTLCKHVHLVRMYEERMGTNSVLDQVAQSLGEKSHIKKHHQEEINEFIIDRVAEANQATETQGSSKRSLQLAQFKNFVEGLDDNNFYKFMKDIQGTVHKYEENASSSTQKRKMDKQEYFPTSFPTKQTKRISKS